jgi:CheY-like chemotaxis protein
MSGVHDDLNGAFKSAPIKVLVVDDDLGVRQILRMMLELEGFSVFEASNGAEGISVAIEHDPDFVVLDYMMPGLDGESAARSMRDLVPSAALIAFSAGLISPPYWAHIFLPKERIGDLPEVLRDEWAIRQARLAEPASEPVPANLSVQVTHDDEPFSVLVVDDYPRVRRVVTKALEASGFFRVVGEAANGVEALAATSRLQPDVIILDLSMPERGGLDVLPHLRESAPSSIVAILSGIGPEVLGKAVWRSGADLYLQKTSPMKDIVAELLTEIQVRQALVLTG